MGEGRLCYKRKYHQEEDNPGDRETHRGPKGSNKTSQGYYYDRKHIICEHNTILPDP